jgi:hypothetical protein
MWKLVEHNIARFGAMRMRNPNIQLQACITVNVFNVMYLEKVANWADAQDFNFIYWNMLHEARYHSIGCLPDLAKQIIKAHLSNIAVSAKNKFEIDRIVEFMMNGQSLDGSELLANIKQVDDRRGQDLRTYHYEFAKAIGYNGK